MEPEVSLPRSQDPATCPYRYILTLTPPTWRIWWAPNNASRWQMEFNLVFKGFSYAYIFRFSPIKFMLPYKHSKQTKVFD